MPGPTGAGSLMLTVSRAFAHHNMKLTIIFAGLALVAVATLLVACKRESKSFTEQSSGAVAFADAGVSLDVGEGWKRIDISPGPPVCPPTLVGEHGMVRAMLFAPDLSDLQKAAGGLRSTFDANAEAVKDSFREQEFAAESGLRGLHVSYAQRSEKEGRVTEMHSHNYIVTNRAGRCVSISYLATAARDSDVVHGMIRKSLRLQ
jgi:hypothetical protein